MVLQGKSAIITGSTTGIGAAIAERFAKEGANILINGIEVEASVGDHLDNLRALGVKVEYSNADMRKADQIEAMVMQAKKAFGTVDILVNNAGIQHKALVEDFPDEKWEAIIAINLSSAFYTMKHVVPIMKAQNFGRIVNIASAHGLVASDQKAAYVAAKHGVLGLTKVVAVETATYNITANSLCPGWVETAMVKRQIEDRAKANGRGYEEEAKLLVGEKQPNQRFQTLEAIADGVMYLVNPVNQYSTGSSLVIDGGWTAV